MSQTPQLELPALPEIRVESWAELMAALHRSELIPVNEDIGGHRRSPCVFRGVDNAAWGLETSLQRLPHGPGTTLRLLEQALIRNFRKYASAGTFDAQSEWYVLAVAQHNGLPTRCLDWTSAPLVAAHFACGDVAQKDADGVIWCLHAGLLRDHNEWVNTHRGVSDRHAWVFDTRMLEGQYRDLDELDARRATAEGAVTRFRIDMHMLMLWEPPSLDARIASQAGLLSIMNDAEASQDRFLRQLADDQPGVIQRIVIAAAAKSEIRDLLDQNGISERSLYPGLPGLCQWLKRYYSQAW